MSPGRGALAGATRQGSSSPRDAATNTRDARPTRIPACALRVVIGIKNQRFPSRKSAPRATGAPVPSQNQRLDSWQKIPKDRLQSFSGGFITANCSRIPATCFSSASKRGSRDSFMAAGWPTARVLATTFSSEAERIKRGAALSLRNRDGSAGEMKEFANGQNKVVLQHSAAQALLARCDRKWCQRRSKARSGTFQKRRARGSGHYKM